MFAGRMVKINIVGEPIAPPKGVRRRSSISQGDVAPSHAYDRNLG